MIAMLKNSLKPHMPIYRFLIYFFSLTLCHSPAIFPEPLKQTKTISILYHHAYRLRQWFSSQSVISSLSIIFLALCSYYFHNLSYSSVPSCISTAAHFLSLIAKFNHFRQQILLEPTLHGSWLCKHEFIFSPSIIFRFVERVISHYCAMVIVSLLRIVFHKWRLSASRVKLSKAPRMPFLHGLVSNLLKVWCQQLFVIYELTIFLIVHHPSRDAQNHILL